MTAWNIVMICKIEDAPDPLKLINSEWVGKRSRVSVRLKTSKNLTRVGGGISLALKSSPENGIKKLTVKVFCLRKYNEEKNKEIFFLINPILILI